MRQFLTDILVASVLTAVPFSGANASKNGTEQPIVEKVQKGQIGTLTKAKAQELKTNSIKVENYQSIISPELTKSPNYAFTLQAYQTYTSPVFTHTSGDVLVTLVNTTMDGDHRNSRGYSKQAPVQM